MKEIHRVHLKAQENYRNSSERQATRLEQEYRTLLRLSQDLNFNLMRMEATIDNLYQKGNELPNFWVKRMYFNSILVGICSAIIVMVIVWIIGLWGRGKERREEAYSLEPVLFRGAELVLSKFSSLPDPINLTNSVDPRSGPFWSYWGNWRGSPQTVVGSPARSLWAGCTLPLWLLHLFWSRLQPTIRPLFLIVSD